MEKKRRRLGTCNVYPRVWAAIYGCEGVGPRRRVAGQTMHACASCAAMKRVTWSYGTGHIQAHLREAQDLAGVGDYRQQRTGRDAVTRRPYLVLDGERVTLSPVTERWGLFAPIGTVLA